MSTIHLMKDMHYTLGYKGYVGKTLLKAFMASGVSFQYQILIVHDYVNTLLLNKVDSSCMEFSWYHSSAYLVTFMKLM